MSVLEFILLLIVAGLCGAVAQALVGYSRGGCLVAIALGFIGALLGTWLARALSLPELFTIQVGDQSFVGVSLSGEVATMINQAQQDRSTNVAEARSRAETFRAKLVSYRANPTSFLTYELTTAYTAFMQNGVVETFLIPDDTQPFVLKLTRDPEFQREIERAQKRRDLLENPQRERALQAGKPLDE